MKILYIGTTAHFYSSNLAEGLNEYPNVSVNAIFASTEKDRLDISCKYNKVFYYKYFNRFKIPKLNGVMNTLSLIFTLLSINKYDVIHLHYISSTMYYLMPIFKIKSNKIISTVWGSDFDKPTNIKYLRSILKHSDLITSSSDAFKKRIELFLNNSQKIIVVLDFHHSVLSELDKLEELSKQEIKKSSDLPNDIIIIGCGTNLRKMQHHLEIIDAIAKVKDKITSSFIVLIQMTYGYQDEIYLSEIMSKLKSYGINFIILSKQLTDSEIARVRKSTDILIQVQDHDQLSGAMLETLYANNIVVTGSWLPYEVLDKEEVFYFKVNDLSELGDVILDTVNNYVHYSYRASCNTQLIKKITQHGSIIDKWFNTYQELLN